MVEMRHETSSVLVELVISFLRAPNSKSAAPQTPSHLVCTVSRADPTSPQACRDCFGVSTRRRESSSIEPMSLESVRMENTVDIDSILMPPPSKRSRGGTIVSPDEALSKDVAFSLPSTMYQTAVPVWSSPNAPVRDGSQDEICTDGIGGRSSGYGRSTKAPQQVSQSDVEVSRAAGEESLKGDCYGDGDDSIKTDSTTLIDSVDGDASDRGALSLRQTPITTRFSDIVGHAAAKLRIDEMLLPLALPAPIATSVLTGKYRNTIRC